MNATLFGNKVFVDTIKLRWALKFRVGPKSYMTGVLIREGGETERYMRKGHVRPMQRLDAAASQRTPSNDNQRLERGKESLS